MKLQNGNSASISEFFEIALQILSTFICMRRLTLKVLLVKLRKTTSARSKRDNR